MQIQITSTENITHMDGVPVRVWHGVTAEGVRCFVFVQRIAVAKSEDLTEFDRALREQPPHSCVVQLADVL